MAHHHCICSFCEEKIRFDDSLNGNRGKCPKCHSTIRLIDQSLTDLHTVLSSQWHVKVPKNIVFSETLGPLSEVQFVQMFDAGRLNDRCEVMSSRFTHGQWLIFTPSIMPPVIEEARQLAAEAKRLARLAQRKLEIDNENRARIRKFIKQAVADGVLSSEEKTAIDDFAQKAQLNPMEISAILREESEQIIQTLLSDALVDGILAPDEEQNLLRFSAGLGISVELSAQQQRSMELAKHAYDINMRDAGEFDPMPVDFALQAKETCIDSARLEWNEIVELKRPKGLSLGGNRYLKSLATGNVYLTNKRVLLDSDFAAKKATLTSIQRINIYKDGLFLNRTSGKSLFLSFPAQDDLSGIKFGMTLKRIVADTALQGYFPTENFIPEQVLDAEVLPQEVVATSAVTRNSSREPRYTFRVVGDHIGDRSYWIGKLHDKEPVQLVREPRNAYDENAVLIVNRAGKDLGYLKREVAAWFAPILDRGKNFTSNVHRVRSDGVLIVAVFEGQ